MTVGGRRVDPYDNQAAHPGKSCTAECAEFGCAPWTASDPLVLRQRSEIHGHGERLSARGIAAAVLADPLDGPHVSYPQPCERPAPDATPVGGADRSGARP